MKRHKWHNITRENNKNRKGVKKTKTIWRLWTFSEEGECDSNVCFCGTLTRLIYLVLDSATIDNSCIWLMVKLVNMFTTIYVYSLNWNININYGNDVLL